jgi:hypothetical protein
MRPSGYGRLDSYRFDSRSRWISPTLWDEGYTLSVARNWGELGHYGRLLNGELVPRGLEAAFPLTGSVALSFQLFGVGIYQARLVSVASQSLRLDFITSFLVNFIIAQSL